MKSYWRWNFRLAIGRINYSLIGCFSGVMVFFEQTISQLFISKTSHYKKILEVQNI